MVSNTIFNLWKLQISLVAAIIAIKRTQCGLYNLWRLCYGTTQSNKRQKTDRHVWLNKWGRQSKVGYDLNMPNMRHKMPYDLWSWKSFKRILWVEKPLSAYAWYFLRSYSPSRIWKSSFWYLFLLPDIPFCMAGRVPERTTKPTADNQQAGKHHDKKKQL